MGYNRLYLVTDLVGFYEKCGWEYLGDAHDSRAARFASTAPARAFENRKRLSFP